MDSWLATMESIVRTYSLVSWIGIMAAVVAVVCGLFALRLGSRAARMQTRSAAEQVEAARARGERLEADLEEAQEKLAQSEGRAGELQDRLGVLEADLAASREEARESRRQARAASQRAEAAAAQLQQSAAEETAPDPVPGSPKKSAEPLTQAERNRFLAALKGGATGNISIVALAGDQKSMTLARELHGLFSEAGWTSGPVQAATFPEPPRGVFFVVQSQETIPGYTSSAAKALKAIGLIQGRPTVRLNSKRHIGYLGLVIGSRP